MGDAASHISFDGRGAEAGGWREREHKISAKSGPEVIKLFSCSTQLSMKFFLLINVKMPTIVGILTFRSRKNSILSLSESEKKLNFLIFLYL